MLAVLVEEMHFWGLTLIEGLFSRSTILVYYVENWNAGVRNQKKVEESLGI